MIDIVIVYYLVINIITFSVWGYDKFRSKFNQWRVPEKSLFVLIFLGGGVGALGGMTFFRHKTRKSHFKILSIISLVVHIFLIFYLVQS